MIKPVILALVLLMSAQTACAERSAWFNKSSKLLLSKEISVCQDYKKAGNIPKSKECVTSKLNAYDVVRQKMDDPSVSPFIGDSVCTDKIRLGFEYGARCMAAAAEICVQDPSGNIANPLACLRTFSSGNWQTHPSAQKLDFSWPARSDDEVKKYM